MEPRGETSFQVTQRQAAEILQSITEEREMMIRNRVRTNNLGDLWRDQIIVEDSINLDTGSREVTSNRKKRMKERHLNQDERQSRHKPATDWREYKRGEKCFNASSLDVSDIVTKHTATA